MKKCPYCAEEIQDEAIKCRYCGEWLREEKKETIDETKNDKFEEKKEKAIQSDAKKCPHCSLINPETAQRCDCGYDFAKGIIEKSYYRQRLPKEIKTYISIIIPLNLLGAFGALAAGDIVKIAIVLVWSVAVYSLYSELIRKKNWARIALIVLTFPIGLILGLSQEAKLYCKQKD